MIRIWPILVTFQGSDLPQVRVVFRTLSPKAYRAAANRLVVATAFVRVSEIGVDTLTSGNKSAQVGSPSMGDAKAAWTCMAVSRPRAC